MTGPGDDALFPYDPQNDGRSSSQIKVGSNHPFVVGDFDRVWSVVSGHVDLFLTPMCGEEADGIGRHLARITAGGLVFGVPPIPYGDDREQDGLDRGSAVWAIRAVAAMGSELLQTTRNGIVERAQRLGEDAAVADRTERWVATLSASLTREIGVRGDHRLSGAENAPIKAGTCLTGGVNAIWVTVERGTLRFLGNSALVIDPRSPPLPVTERTWLTVETKSEIACRTTSQLLADGTLWPALDAFHALVMRYQRGMALAARAADLRRQDERVRLTGSSFVAGLKRMAAVLSDHAEPVVDTGADALFAACRLVGEACGLALTPPKEARPATVEEHVRLIANHNRLNVRSVVLETGWHRRDCGPLLSFLKLGKGVDVAPAALLPVSSRAYDVVDLASGARKRCDDAVALRLGPEAYAFYRPLPDKPLTIREVLRFGARGLLPDFRLLVVMGLLSGLLGLVLPIATGKLFSEILPMSDLPGHISIVVALIAAAFGNAAFETVRGLAALRVQGRMDGAIQAAVWDRLLRLPAGFFRRYSVGDLADRSTSIGAIREILTSAVTSTILDGVFSVFSFALLFYYSWKLALVATGVSILALSITVALTAAQMPHQRTMMERMGWVEGLSLQMLSAISKLRNSGSEARMLARWMSALAEQKSLALKLRKIGSAQQVVAQVFPILASMTLFLAIMKLGAPEEGGDRLQPLVDIGTFVSFNAAFGQFLSALMSITNAISTTVAIVPLYERVKPILTETPEVRESADAPGELLGDIDFSHVTFRYGPNLPTVFQDLSWRTDPGDYIAFVGPSGSGKSTIIRLLLGFERPESGAIYFSGKEVGSLDMAAVRRQIGVVMQNGRLLPGSLLENIVGSAALTQQDAWDAARAAGLDADIKAMPMGMQTVLSEGVATLSGGQRQRLMIARALVRKPRILLFDEATSALDNQTQAVVNETLGRLNITRIVVAHRLSTIRSVRRIYVLKDGGIVESGSYDELLAAKGVFAQLAMRQLI